MEDLPNGCQVSFLNGFLEEEVCIEEFVGNEVKGHEDKILKLKKALYGLKQALYGLKQALRAYYSHIDNYFLKNGFVKYSHEYPI